jgi:hypothetical protein
MESVAWGGVALSTALAGIGVTGLVGLGSPLAIAGSIALIVGTLLTETAASRLPVHADSRFAEGAWVKGALVVVGFVLLTAWNVTAGHMGMVAIDRAGVADIRAPIEQAANEADAALRGATASLEAFDAETAQREALLADGLRGAFQAGYVTAASRSLQADDGRAERRQALVMTKAQAEATQATAAADLARAPTGRSDWELWAFALLLELIKGALVWFAQSSERKTNARRQAEVISLAPTKTPGEMTDAELADMASRGASLVATVRHERERRKKRIAA